MEPASIGFDMYDVEIITKLPEEVQSDLADICLHAVVCMDE